MTRSPSFSKQTVGFVNSRPQISGVCFLADQLRQFATHQFIKSAADPDSSQFRVVCTCGLSGRSATRRMRLCLDAGSFDVAYLDGWPSDFFYFEDNSGRRLRLDVMTRPEAQRAAQGKARQHALDEINFREAVPDRCHYLARALLLPRRGRSTPGRRVPRRSSVGSK